MKAYVVYTKVYDFEQECMTIGGVQTYIQGLLPILKSLGFDIYIYQMGVGEDSISLEAEVSICQVDASKYKERQDKINYMVDEIMKKFDNETDLLIFMANEITCKSSVKRSIAIQHGISWDSLSLINRPEWQNKISFLMKSRRSYKIIRKLNEVNHIVCVDHNFPNWLRATAVRFKVPMTVIPNFTRIAPVYKKPSDKINIIFARRFFPYRGTRLFIDAITQILKNNPFVYVTLAGTGPDEKYMIETLRPFGRRVSFIQYQAEQALQVHEDQHIAVVPTMGSEGTSLSLLEAMSAQCAVVTTDIGGLSNIVIDGYNAIYSRMDSEDLADKIQLLIDDKELRNNISYHAYETVQCGFSYEVWTKRWTEFLKRLMQ